MARLKIVISYDGTEFHGFQRQAGLPTVQGELERALAAVLRRPVEVTGASRTDAGVHACGQVAHFDWEPQQSFPPDRLARALSGRLPRSVSIHSASPVPDDFHARHSARWKIYRYRIATGAVRDPFLARYALHRPGRLDLEAMREAALAFVGRHDFTSFCSSRTSAGDKVRRVDLVAVREAEGGQLAVDVAGDGFLHNMVRILVGTLLEIGRGRRRPEEVSAVLAARDRRLAGPTAPPHGLCLQRIGYADKEEGGGAVEGALNLDARGFFPLC